MAACRWYVWPRRGQLRRLCGDCGRPPTVHDGERRALTCDGEEPARWVLEEWGPSEAEHLEAGP